MNARQATMIAVVLSFGLFTLEEPALAQEKSAAQSRCKQIKGRAVEVFDGGSNSSSGTITNGGDLSGPFEVVFTPGFVPTPLNTVVFVGDITIFTIHGWLKTSLVFLYEVSTGLSTAMGLIDADNSTGKFAGATGVLYQASSTTGPDTFLDVFSGEICFASARAERGERADQR